MKKLVSFILAVLLVISIVPAAFAAENDTIIREVSREVIYLDDGSYIVAIEYEHENPRSSRATGTVTKSKNYIYHDAIGTELYMLKLTASFAFTDQFVRASSASYNYEIYKNLYRFGGGNASYNSNYAFATGTFYDSLGNRHRTLSITATCDSNGNVTFSLSNY